MSDTFETAKALHDFATDYREQERHVEVLTTALETLVRAARTAALLLRKDHPTEAASLREKISAAKTHLTDDLVKP